jgi:hypothetical protein
MTIYLIAVRPDSQHGLPMPRPDGRNIYTSPEIDPVPAAPYIETMSAITVSPRATYDATDVLGPVTIIDSQGTASVQIGNEITQLSGGGMAFAQMGQTLAIGNHSSGTLKVLDFAISTAPSPPPPAVSPPPGGPVPAQLQGNWFLAPAAVDAILGHEDGNSCPSPPVAVTATNCFFLLNLTATTFHLEGTGIDTGSGNVVVNGNEIDFFNGALCYLQLPDGVGRYRWTLKSGVLRLTLISDPCNRAPYMANQSWRHTH